MRAHITSPEFLTYIEAFPDAYEFAKNRSGVSIEQPGDSLTSLGRFYQFLWEALPDAPGIRHGAFYRICDFAEAYCFPDNETNI